MRSNLNKKIIYSLIILLLFVAMYPYGLWLAEEKKRRDLGEAAIGQIDTGSFMMKLFLLGGFRGIVANYSGSAPRKTNATMTGIDSSPTSI